MDSLKDAAAKVGDKVSNATSTDKSNSAGEGVIFERSEPTNR